MLYTPENATFKLKKVVIKGCSMQGPTNVIPNFTAVLLMAKIGFQAKSYSKKYIKLFIILGRVKLTDFGGNAT